MNYLGEYTEVGWENEPSQKTPINAKNLGIMEDAIKRIFNYLIAGGAPVVPENPEISGKDGREIELRNNGAFIQWRYAGDENWSDLVSLEELKGDEGAGIKSIKYIDSNGLVDTYAITLTNGMETTFSVTNGKNGTDANVTSENIKMALGYTPADAEKVSELSGQNVDRGTSLWAIVKKTAFVEALTDEELTKFKTAWGIADSEEEPDTPVEPDEPEITLSSITATYTGGDVAVGTALTDLTGITVTAHYSDGSTANVTGYTLSGTIAEGSNTITISYSGKTTTFTVTGVAEPGGDEPDEPVTTLSGYQITEFGNVYADRDTYAQWKWNNGIANRFMFNTKLFPAGTYWIRSLLKNPNSASGYAPVMYQTADADWLTTKSDTPTAITEDSFTTAVNLGDTNSQTWLGVYSDGSYALVPNNDISGVAGYVYLKKVTIPEGYYGILSMGSGSGSNVAVYVKNWITVFNEDPTDNITCTEVTE